MILLTAFTVAACTNNKKYSIGVSQCIDNARSEQVIAEISHEARYFGDMDVEYLLSDNDNQKQIEDIDKFIDDEKDLIIVAPNEVEYIRPVLEKAYNKGIPLVLLDRKINSYKYTAFVGLNNTEIGEKIGSYIAEDSEDRNGVVSVVELRGLEHSAPAIERHHGFASMVEKYNNSPDVTNIIKIVGEADGDWHENEAMKSMDSLRRKLPHIDYVFAHNDEMAVGAYKAIKKAGRENEMKILGVGAQMDSNGIDMIIEGKLTASALTPTCGSEAMKTAHKILKGEQFERIQRSQTAMVESEHASALKLQNEAMIQLGEKYQNMEMLNDLQADRIKQQQWILLAAILIVILLVLLFVVQHRVKKEMAQNDEMLMMQLQMQMTEKAPVVAKSEDGEVSDTEEKEAGEEAQESDGFCEAVEKIIIDHIGDSGFSVNDIASELGISRVQLYRKIKTRNEQNVSELIRKARLERAQELLNHTHKTISEIAYEVGFSSSSYFTKCFKEYFGYGPSERAR